jgi:hypothetical protein
MYHAAQVVFADPPDNDSVLACEICKGCRASGCPGNKEDTAASPYRFRYTVRTS